MNKQPNDQQTGRKQASDQQQRQAGSQQGQQGDDRQRSQQQGGGTDNASQPQQFESPVSDRQDASSNYASRIREHMEVIGADGAHVGKVDAVEGDRIKLTKADSGMGSHEGHHHFIPLSEVSGIDGDRVRLLSSGATAYRNEQER